MIVYTNRPFLGEKAPLGLASVTVTCHALTPKSSNMQYLVFPQKMLESDQVLIVATEHLLYPLPPCEQK